MNESDAVTIRPEDGRQAQGVRYAACSVTGARESQQDSLFVGEAGDAVFAVVCDGMGGLCGGERASGLAVQMLTEAFFEQEPSDPPRFYREMAGRIDGAVCRLEENGRRLGAGTTAVSVTIRCGGLYWFSVGDSRVYLHRRGELLCPVPAHNYKLLLDALLDSGAIGQEKYAAELPRGEALISFLGAGGVERMEINPRPFRLEPGDQILLCSDGLYKSLCEAQIREILDTGGAPDAKARRLVDEAAQAGGASQDNTSVVLLQI